MAQERLKIANIMGPQGNPGPQGDKGDQGVPGNPGVGVPEGGTTGQVLKKKSDSDYDTEWKDESGGGSSITTNGNKFIKAITRNSNGAYVRVMIETTDGSFYNVVGLPEGAEEGAYLRSGGTAQTAATWEKPGQVASGDTGLVTGDAVYQAIQAQMANFVNAEQNPL